MKGSGVVECVAFLRMTGVVSSYSAQAPLLIAVVWQRALAVQTVFMEIPNCMTSLKRRDKGTCTTQKVAIKWYGS